DAACRGRRQRNRAERPGGGGAEGKVGPDRGQGEGVEQEVHRVQHPAELGGEQDAPLAAGDFSMPAQSLQTTAGQGSSGRTTRGRAIIGTMTVAEANLNARYELKSGKYSSHSLLLSRFAAAGDGRRVLDVGCAEGFLADLLAQRGYAVTGVDWPGT